MNNKKVFQKLVRDRIPELIERNGAVPDVEILDDLRFAAMLDEKLLEECGELLAAKDVDSKIEEMADILEVLHAMAEVWGLTMAEVEAIRLRKRAERGAFQKKLLLISASSKREKGGQNADNANRH